MARDELQVSPTQQNTIEPRYKWTVLVYGVEFKYFHVLNECLIWMSMDFEEKQTIWSTGEAWYQHFIQQMSIFNSEYYIRHTFITFISNQQMFLFRAQWTLYVILKRCNMCVPGLRETARKVWLNWSFYLRVKKVWYDPP